MARYNYIVTEITKRCPYCGKTVGTETKADQTPPHLIILLLAIFPITIPYWILRYLAFKNPNFPKVGPKTFQCPHCYLPIRTDNYAVEDLDSKNLFLHKFKKWIYISYVIGAVCGVCVFGIIAGTPVVSVLGLFALLSLIVAVAIVIIYHVKLEEIMHPKPKAVEQPKQPQKDIAQNSVPSFFYCRKCGTKLPSDSRFCDKCGTKLE